MAEPNAESETSRTDQDKSRRVGDRLIPPTVPNRESIRQDRAALDQEHTADRMPTADEEQAADEAGEVDPEVAKNYKDALERGASQEGEGRIIP